MSDRPRQLSDLRTIGSALVAYAARDGLGETPSWTQLFGLLRRFAEQSEGPRHLRDALRRVNVDEAFFVLEDWLERAIEIETSAAEAATRAGEKVLHPIQMGGIGGFVTVSVLTIAGSLGPPVGGGLILGALCVAAAATYGRWRLARRADRRAGIARRLKRCVTLLKDELDRRDAGRDVG